MFLALLDKILLIARVPVNSFFVLFLVVYGLIKKAFIFFVCFLFVFIFVFASGIIFLYFSLSFFY